MQLEWFSDIHRKCVHCVEVCSSPLLLRPRVLEIIEPVAEVVESESTCLGNVPVQWIHPGLQVAATPSAGDLHLEGENQMDSAEAYR